MITMIAAIAENNCIGQNGTLPWRLPEDQKRFKQLTMGHVVLMGRKTWESLPEKFRPLPGRTNAVLTRQTDYPLPPEVKRVFTITEATQLFRNQTLDIIGGADVYRLGLPLADRLEITRVHQTIDGDAFFPEFNLNEWKEIFKEEHDGYTFLTYDRIAFHHN